MKYVFRVIFVLSAVLLFYFVWTSNEIKIKGIDKENSDSKSNIKVISSEQTDSLDTTVYDLNTELKQGYETIEYYIYDISSKCESFVRNNIRTIDDLNEFLLNVSLADENQNFYFALANEMKDNYEVCTKFIEVGVPNIDGDARKKLLDMAVEKKDLSALARKAFEDVFFDNKKISTVKTALVESLVSNNPEALYTLSMFVQQFSKTENKFLLGAAIMSRACDAGYKDCGYNSLMVQQTCQQESICGSNLQETIRMSVSSDLSNEFENMLVEVNDIKTEKEWKALIDVVLHE